MRFAIDLHPQSKYTRASSHGLDLEQLYLWAKRKGLRVVGTGGILHPRWFAEFVQKLEPSAPGLYRLRPSIVQGLNAQLSPSLHGRDVHFLLGAEIHSHGSLDSNAHKLHQYLHLPSLDSAAQLLKQLGPHGVCDTADIPHVTLPGRTLLQLIQSLPTPGVLYPARAWSPTHDLFGCPGGSVPLSAHYGESVNQLLGLDIGASLRPEEIRRCSTLDDFNLLLGSNAAQGQGLGRYAMVLDCALNYDSIIAMLRHPTQGPCLHYLCNDHNTPMNTAEHHALREMQDRQTVMRAQASPPYRQLPDLHQLLASLLSLAPDAAQVQAYYHLLLTQLGPELPLLYEYPLEEFQIDTVPGLAAALRDARRPLLPPPAPTKQLDLFSMPLFAHKPKSTKHPKRRAARTKTQTMEFPWYGEAFTTSTPRTKTSETPAFSLSKEAPSAQGATAPVTETTTTRASNPTAMSTTPQHPPRPASTEALSSQPVVHPRSQETSTVVVQHQHFQTATHLDDQTHIASAKQLLQGLNTEQRAIVQHVGSPMLVMAGPGTGKTRTMLRRIAYLDRSQQLHASHLLVLAVTTQSATHFSRQLTKLLGPRHSVTVTTFQRFCLEWLLGAPVFHTLLTEPERAVVLEQLAHQHGFHPSPALCQRWLRQFSQHKQRSDTYAETKPLPLLEGIPAQLFEAYQDALQQHQRIDLDDLLWAGIRHLKQEPEFRRQLQLRFRSFHVDNVQDLSIAQYELLRLLWQPGHDLCACGDPDQDTESAPSTDFQIFHRFQQDFVHGNCQVQRSTLWRNYRSPATILNAAQDLMELQPDAQRIPLDPTQQGEHPVLLSLCRDDIAEAEWIVQRIEGLLSFDEDRDKSAAPSPREHTFSTISFSNIAVMYRTEAQLPALQDAFERAGLPYRVAPARGLMAAPELQLCFALLRTLPQEESEISTLATLFHHWPGLGPAFAEEIQRHPDTELRSPAAWYLYSRTAPNMTELQQQALLELTALLSKVQDQQHKDTTTLLEELFAGLYDNPKLSHASLPREEHQEALLQQAQDFPHVPSFLLQLFLSQTPHYLDATERITLLNLRAAKGLEYPVVFITGCDQGILPHEEAIEHPTQLPQECRLFYLGQTRAQQHLFLSRALQRQHQGAYQATEASIFLQPMQTHLAESTPLHIPTQRRPRPRPKLQRLRPVQRKLF